MGRSKLDFRGDEVTRAIVAELNRRLHRCAILVWNRWKELINVDGTGVGPSGRLIYGADPSKPGEPPHKQRGRLLASAAFEVVGLVARVGTNLLYGRILELGGRNVAARPSLRVALRECRDQIRAILSAPMKGP